jgi:signal transduction histidine kinase
MQTRITADAAEEIYAHPDDYRQHPLAYLQPDEVGHRAAYLMIAPGIDGATAARNSAVFSSILPVRRGNILEEIGATDAYLGSEDGWFLDLQNSAMKVNAVNHEYDARTRPWYQEAKKSGRVTWTIQTDAIGRGTAIVCSKPVYQTVNGKRVFRGVVGTGAILQNLIARILDTTHIGISGYAFLMDDNGKTLIRSSNAREHHIPRPMELTGQLARDVNTVETYKVDGSAYYAAHYPLAEIPYNLGVVVSSSEIFSYTARINRSIIITLFALTLLLVAVFLLVTFGSRSLAGALANPVVTTLRTALSDAETAKADAIAASKSKSDFLSRMSHEIRSPMNAIIGMSELMRTDNLDEVQTGYFRDIRTTSHTLLGIINDILDFSKIEAGKMELTPGNYDIWTLFDNIASLNKFVATSKDLIFESHLDRKVPQVVLGDELRVREVYNNIVNNAIKYTQTGSV